MSALRKMLGKSAGLPPLPQGQSSSSGRTPSNKKDYSTLPWTEYFEHRKEVKVGASMFQYYESGSSGPIIMFLHGGGFSGLSWALLTKMLTSLTECRCIAIDMRGHGGTATDNDADMSAGTLACDVGDIVEQLNEDAPIVLIGHSMGGSIAVHTAVLNRLPRLVALVVIDVVEGTALEALHSMRHVLQNRPRYFDSIEKANEWCVRSGYIRNLESARISMVGQLMRKPRGDVETSENGGMSVAEEAEEGNHNADSTAGASNDKYVWRIDLARTEPYWEGWFKGMSSLFLSVPVPKILMLAGVDRLDKELSIGQMQGKFQLQVMSRSGHAVHEDAPDKVAEVIANFLTRHRLAESKR